MDIKVLVLCTGNSCRSQMLHGFLKQHKGLAVYSAGIETHGLNPRAVLAMKEAGIDISDHTSNHIDEYRNTDFDYVITVCDNARESCPLYFSRGRTMHRSFPDPAGETGTEEEIMKAFRDVRDRIGEYAEEVVAIINKDEKSGEKN